MPRAGGTMSGNKPLRAGAAKINITPPVGTHLGGTCGILRGGEVVLERIMDETGLTLKELFK